MDNTERLPEETQDAELFDNAGGEKTSFEFSRKASKEVAMAQKKFKWRSLANIRIIVYSSFLVVLLAFAAFYLRFREYYVAALSIVAALFMIYVLAFGHRLFISVLDVDDEGKEADVRCKICEKNVYLLINGKYECIPFSGVKSVKKAKKYILLEFKNSALCPNGIMFESSSADIENVKRMFDGKKEK